MLSLPPLSAFVIALCTASVKGQDLLAALDYGTFKGVYSSAYNINYWRKIPFAAPPIGENRFRAPQPPIPITDGIYDSDQTFDMCPQRTVNGSEDCLYLNLYSRPWTPSQPLRPVVLTLHGGGFVNGHAAFPIPLADSPFGYPILNVSESNDFIIIYTNYRLNAFGFLPGAEVAASPTSDLNVGLLDQQAALIWVHKYIAKFGGDPKNVTISGQSAGGGGVLAQVIANGGKTDPPLFSKALTSSPFWPKQYKHDSAEAQALYNNFAKLANCTGPDSLACLKKADLQVLRTASLAVSLLNQFTTSTNNWAPVTDGTFIRESLSQATINGRTNSEYGYGFHNTHEGENFIPVGLATAEDNGDPPFNSSIESFNGWLEGFLPGFSPRNIQRVKDLYPSIGKTETSTYNTTYDRAGLIYRDVVLSCPMYWTTRAARKKSYMGEYTISPAKHASDTIYWHRINPIQLSQPLIYKAMAGAIASFFRTGDPNTFKLTDATQPGIPSNWRTGEEFVVTSNGLKTVKIVELGLRCGFWRQLADFVPI